MRVCRGRPGLEREDDLDVGGVGLNSPLLRLLALTTGLAVTPPA